jgi:CheY-like chemotaxis protein
MDILLAASPYDSFLLEEAGQLSERLLGEFRNLDLHYGPGITSVATGEDALEAARQPGGRFQLILSTLHLEDMTSDELARRVRAAGLDVPVVALAFDNRELKDFVARHDLSALERVFLWQGDARILVGIVKSVEDRRNVAHDTRAMGVQVVLVVEDNVRYYSSFLPTIYAELLQHSQHLLADSVNLSHKILRMRARPKILLCNTFEEAWDDFTAYQDDILGVISDVEFPRGGHKSLEAGLDLAARVREHLADVPVLLHSSRPENAARARAAGADFILKGSPLLLAELRRFMVEELGFGDFVFRLPSGAEVARASDLRTLEGCLRAAPDASVAYHAERNHFSKWLKARTEFALAQELRPKKLADFGSVEGLRRARQQAITQ